MDHGARIVSLGCGPLPFLHVESHAYRTGRIKDDGFRSPEQFFRAYLAELLGAMAHVTQEHSDPLPVNVKTARNVVSCWQIDKFIDDSRAEPTPRIMRAFYTCMWFLASIDEPFWRGRMEEYEGLCEAK